MIYTVTLNPSLDYYMELDELQTGEINRSKAEHLEVGGKGINVSKVLKELGVESTVCGFYAGLVGNNIVSETQKLGLENIWIEVRGNSRINVKLLCQPETAINGSGCEANIEDLDKLCEAGAQNCIVSMGEMGSVFVSNTEAHIVKAKEVDVKSTVGAGDALLAGMIYGLSKRMRPEEALVFATRLAEKKVSAGI